MIDEKEGGSGRSDSVAEIDVPSRLMRLFEGFHNAYGTYDSTIPNEEKGGKLEIKQTATTRRSPVTRELWTSHLMGDYPLGIIPIRDNNTCLWGVIDVDQYGIDHANIFKKIKKENLPLVVCRSKSGGAHLFLFMAEPVSADLIQGRLKEMAALLGYGSAEVFPKQRIVHTERGDLGSWLNMPYFGGDETDRYCVKESGLAMGVEEFVNYAESLQQSRSFLANQQFRKQTNVDPDFGDGPPCMQHLSSTGFPEGMRNKGLFALASFAKKKYGVAWTDMVEKWNRDFFDPPLPSVEVLQIIRSHEKKEYNYTCREHPLSAHCNSSLCRTRKYGVGGDDDYPVISGLSVLDTEPPLWFLDVDDARLELSTDELQNYKAFHKVCMERLFKCYRMMKQESWFSIVALAMRDAVRIQASEEVGVGGQFVELLDEFVMNRHRAEVREELLLGRPWFDEEHGRHYFRLRDLTKFLENSGFKVFSAPQIVTRIKSMGGEAHFFNLKGKGCNTWWVPASSFSDTPLVDTPRIRTDPI